jgi:hypothetical protein
MLNAYRGSQAKVYNTGGMSVAKICKICDHYKPLIENDVYGRCYERTVPIIDEGEKVAAPHLVYAYQVGCCCFNQPFTEKEAMEVLVTLTRERRYN